MADNIWKQILTGCSHTAFNSKIPKEAHLTFDKTRESTQDFKKMANCDVTR